MHARALVAVTTLLLSAPAAAQTTLIGGLGGPSGYGAACLSPNDDSSSAEISLGTAFPGGLMFFGNTYDHVYVNTNGNITFDASVWTYTPKAFPIADQPMIAPYWSDVDIRGTSCSGSSGSSGCMNDGEDNGVWWHLERGRMVVTWDRVGYFSCNDEKKMTFQLILTEAQSCGVRGDFDVEFRFTQCEWEVGRASGDSNENGLCDDDESNCTPAQIGFDAGNEADFLSVMGSRMDGVRDVACTGSNVGVPGTYRFRIRNGAIECPDANMPCNTGEEGVCGEGRTYCVGASTVCRSVHASSEERCDALDNDCDGETDEDDDLCGVQVCHRGRCIDSCFEGGCPSGETCTDDGVCTENACDEVTCASGERCISGECVSVCEGVVCPAGQNCSAGRCFDLCDVSECGQCQVCVAGSCLLHCAVVGCPEGMACEENGECVEDACLYVRCGPGRTCRQGICASSCAGVTCPEGERCEEGECTDTPLPMRDGGMDDGGVDPGDAGIARHDAGRRDGGTERETGGCGCRASGSSGQASWLLFALLGLALRRARGAR
jgi:hypothetical protein